MFKSGSTGAAAAVPFGRAFTFAESPPCKVGLTLLPLAIADEPTGPSKERSFRFVIELDVSERESSIPRGRAGAIGQLKNSGSEHRNQVEGRNDNF